MNKSRKVVELLIVEGEDLVDEIFLQKNFPRYFWSIP